MAMFGELVSRSIKARKRFALQNASSATYQRNVLRKLMERGQYTAFGKHYHFDKILSQVVDYEDIFRNTVPLHTYNDIYDLWWSRAQNGEDNITWPGKVKYFALSSGTSEASSKRIPVTADMIKAIKKMGFKQLYSMANFEVPATAFQKGILMLGGSTSLYDKGDYYESDMSGISAKTMPRWLSNFFYKPGQKISATPEWKDRIAQIVAKAPTWDVGTICGVPAWVQLVMEEIIAYHKVQNIHDIWPNLSVYIHGGIAFDPYRESIKKLMGKPITYIETYMASEGSFGFQSRPNEPGIKLVLNNGVYYEFIPFDEQHFDEDGNPKPGITTKTITEVEEGQQYAIVISTCAGAWRYIIGDVIKFTNAKEHELIITGRTKQFLSICGEHLSIDNMTKGIELTAKELNILVREFAVEGTRGDDTFIHNWYIGADNPDIDAQLVQQTLDKYLRQLNDDYAVERDSALKTMNVTMLPATTFYNFMKRIGKDGGMHKFPRVLKGKVQSQWHEFITSDSVMEI